MGFNASEEFKSIKSLSASFGAIYYTASHKLTETLYASQMISDFIEEAQKSIGEAKILLDHEGMEEIACCPGVSFASPKEKCRNKDSLFHTIMHLNDDHCWAREDIANWLDTLDEQPIFYPQIEAEDGKALT